MTDIGRDAVAADGSMVRVVRAVLLEAGFSDSQLAGLATVVQSQETVDRDYAGSWFFATR